MLQTERIIHLIEQFNQAIHLIEDVECWSARELAGLFGYPKWENFAKVIEKAKEACRNSGGEVEDHFPEVGKMVQLGSGAEREITDYALSRYACYLVAQNGDSKKEEIAFAQTYFAVQTRNSELIQQRLSDAERVSARDKLKESEKKLSGIIYERGVDDKGFARIRSKGDARLFGGFTTQDMKRKYNVPESRSLADFLPTVTIKAKELAIEITNHNIIAHDLQGESSITTEHEKSNTAVREALITSDIKPENLPPASDVKKVERSLHSEEKKLLSPSKKSKNKSKDDSKA